MDQMSYQLLGPPFTGAIPWYDPNNQFQEPTSGLPFDLGVATMPSVPQVETDDQAIGEDPFVQTFYEGPAKCECCINWVEKPPTQIPEVAKERYDKAAIRIYRAKDHYKSKNRFGGLITTMVQSIEIQSPIIVAALLPIFEDLGMLSSTKGKLRIDRPFKELYFAHARILDLVQQKNPDSEGRKHLDVLVETTNELLAEMTPEIADLQTKKQISCAYLWAIFPKDIIIYSRVDNLDRLYQMIDIEFYPAERPRFGEWVITCRYAQFDGTKFGMARTELIIPEFHGVRYICDLPVYPIGFHSETNLETVLAERGRRVLDFQEITYASYDGVAKAANEDDGDEYDANEDLKTYHVAGRIVIDAFGLGKYELGCAIQTKELVPDAAHAVGADEEEGGFSGAIKKSSSKRSRPLATEQRSNKRKIQAKRQYLLLMSPMLAGFSLERKKWLWFSVDSVQPISWNEEAYDHLVFSEIQKNLVLTFVKNHRQSDNKHKDDVIAGKGEGLIILLSGSSGTGKSLSAEAVADKARRPLYYLHAEDLGTRASSIGYNLSRAFELAEEWNAIILLDEADVFLSKRSLDDSSRNEMVSAFLHHLEYYRGIIFLTTNLLSNIDAAFLSRINIHLRFPDLSLDSRLIIWKNFLSRLETAAPQSLQHENTASSQSGQGHAVKFNVDLSPEDLNSLAAWNLNGREIKNVVKNAHLWCSYNRLSLTLDQIESAINVTAPFAERSAFVVDQSNPTKRPHDLL